MEGKGGEMSGRAKGRRRKITPLSKTFEERPQDQIHSQGEEDVDQFPFPFRFWILACVQLICGAAVYLGLWIVPYLMGGLSIIFQPVETLRICFVVAFPVILFSFSMLRLQPEICPVWWAAFRGFLSLPIGMIVASFIATIFGAPVSYESAVRTLHWGALVSTLTVVPVAAVAGGSWPMWHQLFAATKPNGPLELALCLPAHGAAIGSWVGAWPMPLDWERPWQEWPVCCTYGAVGGYLLTVFVSLGWNAVNLRQSSKGEEEKAK
ncbi:hypothetical protein R1flu_019073 [Riccia fluitans]|uniref:Glycosylphosphatidylinositol anchor biosynthesis protein 11 n=1 Tax=Riccia fluitans TaxID=41844 RepID=A0ABD1ZJ54_9MARC